MDSKSLQNTPYAHQRSSSGTNSSSSTRASSQGESKKLKDERESSTQHESDLEEFQRLLKSSNQQGTTDDALSSEALHSDLSTTIEPQLHNGGIVEKGMPNNISSNGQIGNAAPTEKLVELVTQLVDKMWVKRSDDSSLQAIKMDLKNHHLPGTELTLTKVDGQLMVQFATTAAASYQQLMMGKAQLLQRLQSRYGQDKVVVKIDQLSDEQAQHKNDDTVELSTSKPVTFQKPIFNF